MTGQSEHWPSEVRLSPDKRALRVVFEDGVDFELSAEYLRIESPSAEVQGHSPSEKKTVGGKRKVRILAVSSVGNYALKLQFDDGHDTGIYTWRYLFELGETYATKWQSYLTNLETASLTRD